MLFRRISAIHAIQLKATRVSLGSLYFSFLLITLAVHKALFVSFRVQSELTSSPTFSANSGREKKKRDKSHLLEGLAQEQSNRITTLHPPLVRKVAASRSILGSSNPTAFVPGSWNQSLYLEPRSRKALDNSQHGFFGFLQVQVAKGAHTCRV